MKQTHITDVFFDLDHTLDFDKNLKLLLILFSKIHPSVEINCL
jgi:putative hydrolase of the HAD superfamily